MLHVCCTPMRYQGVYVVQVGVTAYNGAVSVLAVGLTVRY